MQDLRRDLPRLHALLSTFEAASGLRLNMPKTTLIPLGSRSPHRVAAMLRQEASPWAGAGITDHGRYLGFAVGPGRASHSWDAPALRYEKLFRGWRWAALGLQYAIQVYNTCILPSLLFVAQLEAPPPAMLELEGKMLRRVAPGPFKWILPEDLHGLSLRHCFPCAVRSLRSAAYAAQGRVLLWEAASEGGL